MRLREIVVYADEALVEKYQGGFVQRFHRESLCVTTAWMLALGKRLESRTISKLLIVAHEVGALQPPNGHVPMNLWLPFDFVHYHQALNSQKRQLIGDLVRAALETVTEPAGWDPSVISTACTQASAQDFLVKQRINKTWLAPNRQRRAAIDVTWDIDGVRFDAIIAGRQGRTYVEQPPQLLGVVVPFDGCIAAYASGARWLDDQTFCLESNVFHNERLVLRM